MRRATPSIAAALLAAVCAASAARAQEVPDALRVSQQVTQFNARALGMGNSYSTIGYDVSALGFNPATMAASPTFSWTVTTSAEGFKSTTDYYGNRSEFTTSSLTVGQIGMTLPIRIDSTRALILGGSYTRSKDFGSGFRFAGLNDGSAFRSFPEVLAGRADPTARLLGLSFPTYDGSGNYAGDQTLLGEDLYETGYHFAEGALSHYTFGAAIEAAKNFFIGASGTYDTGNYTTDIELTALDVNDAYPIGVQTVPGDARTDGFEGADYRTIRDKQYRGWNARFGMMYRLWDFVGVSGSFHVPGSQEVEEEVFTGGRARFAGNQSIVVPPARTASTFRFEPAPEVTAGAMVNLGIVMGTAEATYVDYTAIRVTSGGGTLPERTELNRQIHDELATVVNLNLGAEVRLPFTGLRARAGGIYQPSPYRADPGRFDRKVVTLGCGYDANGAAQVDLGYAYAWRGEKTAREIFETGQGEDVGSHTLLFTVRAAF